MITAYIWDPESKKGRTLEAALLENACSQLLKPTETMWIDLAAPTQDEEERVFCRFLPIHPLSLEDINRLRREPDSPPHFPKVEEFPEYLLIIVNPITSLYRQQLKKMTGPELSHRPFTQLSGVITNNILITHHYEAMECVDQVQKFLQRHLSFAERGPDYLFHLILDNTVDEYVPVLDFIDETLDHLELEVVQNPRQELFMRLLRLKQEVILLRKTFVLEREVLVRLTRGEFELVSERETVYYRNVYDHLVRFTELIEGSREMVADLMQSYLASTSNKLNEIMKVLTMISTILLPMNFIASIYGMNFEKMPEIKQDWGYPFALGLMAITGMTAFWFFKWRRWI
jgi:magnesium transporter